MSSPFEPFLLATGVTVHIEPPGVPALRMAPPASTTVAVLPVPGPPGPQGLPGSAGGTRIDHPFTNANPVVINHNLGYWPDVTVIVGSEAVDVDVTYGSISQVTITFSSPQTGRAELS